MSRLGLQQRVTDGARQGTTCPPIMPDMPGSIGVAWDDQPAIVTETDPSTLTVLGPENAVPDPKRCGAGRSGGDACIFLTVGAGGFQCERYGSLRWALIFNEGMRARRRPSEPYPGCFLPPATE